MQNLQQLQDLAAALPDSIKENALSLVERMGSVIEGIGDEEVRYRPPFLKIFQATSDRGSAPRGTSVGDLLLGEERIERPLKFIPMRMWNGRQYWDPDQNNTRMLCQSPDAKMGYIGVECKTCPKSAWNDGTNGEKVGSECNKIWSMLAITSDFKNIFNVNFAKTSYGVGTELESAMRKAGVAPYMRTYGLTTETHAKAKNVDIFKLEILDAAARRTDPAVLPFLKALFDEISADRKAMLDAFYESATRRKGTIMIANEADSTLALTDGTDAPAPVAAEGSPLDGTPAATKEEAAAPVKEAKVSTLGKKYTV